MNPNIQAVTARHDGRTVSTVALGHMSVESWLEANGLPVLGTAGLVVKTWAWDDALDAWIPVLSPNHAAAMRRVAREDQAVVDACQSVARQLRKMSGD